MNLRRKHILIAGLVAVAVGMTTIPVLTKEHPIEPTSSRTVEASPVSSAPEESQPVTPVPAPIEEAKPVAVASPKPQAVQPPPPTEDEIEAEAQLKVEQLAAARGWSVMAQGRCLTRGEGFIKGLLKLGYDRAAVMQWVDENFGAGTKVVAGEIIPVFYPIGVEVSAPSDGVKRIRFDGAGTCRLRYMFETN